MHPTEPFVKLEVILILATKNLSRLVNDLAGHHLDVTILRNRHDT